MEERGKNRPERKRETGPTQPRRGDSLTEHPEKGYGTPAQNRTAVILRCPQKHYETNQNKKRPTPFTPRSSPFCLCPSKSAADQNRRQNIANKTPARLL